MAISVVHVICPETNFWKFYTWFSSFNQNVPFSSVFLAMVFLFASVIFHPWAFFAAFHYHSIIKESHLFLNMSTVSLQRLWPTIL